MSDRPACPTCGHIISMQRSCTAFNTVVRQRMTELHMTQVALCKTLGVGRAAVSMQLSSKSEPRLTTIGRYADALQMTLPAFVNAMQTLQKEAV